MGLLATLPRATRGHLGEANNTLTRATRGYLQREAVVVRRPGGGLFAPLAQVEGYRRIEAVLGIMLDGNSRVRFIDELETYQSMSGRLWLSGRSAFTTGRQSVVLRPFLPLPSQGELPLQEPAAEGQAGPAPITRKGTAGLVFALESRFTVGEAPAPEYRQGAAGTLWLDGGSRFQAFEIEVEQQRGGDDEIAIIAALLAQEIDRGF